jgi:flagellar FliJ protein
VPRFAFKLEPVLTMRQRVEREKQALLATAQRDMAQAQARLQAIEDEYERRCVEVKGPNTFAADELRNAYAHMDFLARTADEWRMRVAACFAEVDRARRILMVASRDRKVIERLKERRRETFVAEQFVVEQRELDDQNARRYCATIDHDGEAR